ncbi:hypothetical protein [Gloeothece verrucosa]|uniref:hypothetical protein n=1 Tax=Gloeothece verrucosa TaxID=2546359 RepID=UPI0002DC68F0|nr:hypothetical protein [Gloeothece verrucosa]
MWKLRHAQIFIKYFEQQTPIPAISKDRRCPDCVIVGSVTLTQLPYCEQLSDLPESDVIAEGFPHLSKKEFINQFFGGDDSLTVWVIRFNFTPNASRSLNFVLDK